MRTLEELLRTAGSANERPMNCTDLGRICHKELGWLTLYETKNGEIRYVTDHMREFNKKMEAAERRRKREKRRTG